MRNSEPGILKLIGHTPMVEITRFDTGPCRLFAKLESQNPGGSIKDRIALEMISAAEKEGKLKAGGTIVEATAGNTGLGLALIAALKGYKIILVVPDKMSREKILHCKALGADVRVTRSDVGKGHPEYYQDVAERLAREAGGYYINQFSNPNNPKAHEEGTAPEIWEQMEHQVDAIVCGVGSGGTLSGLGRFFKKVSPETEMIVADPKGSILEPLINRNEKIKPGSWLVEGIGEDFVPDILDLSLTKKAYCVTDEESVTTARQLLQREGILAGPSSGTLFAAALKYCREQKTEKRVVTLVCDRGDKYLSKTFSNFWMTEQGFTERKATNTVEDLIVRRHDSGDTITVRTTDTLKTAYKRMRFADVSQLPVLDDAGKLVGMVGEDTILERMTALGVTLDQPVTAAMHPAVPRLQKSASIAEAAAILHKMSPALIMDGEKFLGLITKVDMLNHLSLKGQAA